MSEDRIVWRAGSLIVFSQGEYSDYGYAGHFVTLEHVTEKHIRKAESVAKRKHDAIDKAQDAWTKESGTPYPPSIDVRDQFIAELVKFGLLLSVTFTELHLGSYGQLDLSLTLEPTS